MRGAVKSVTANAMTSIQLIRQSVKERMFRQCLMKCRIEDGDLRQRSAQSRARREDALDIRRVMKRRELNAVFNAAQYFIGYQYGAGEAFATVYYAMTNSMNIGNTVDVRNSRVLRHGPTKNYLHGCARIANRLRETFWRIAFRS